MLSALLACSSFRSMFLQQASELMGQTHNPMATFSPFFPPLTLFTSILVQNCFFSV